MMLSYLIAVIKGNAPSFCYYENKQAGPKNRDLMPLDIVKKVIAFAMSRKLAINFLGIDSSLPEVYKKEIYAYENYIKFIPVEEDDGAQNTILIVDSHKKDRITEIKDNSIRNIILRLEKKHLSELFPLVRSLLFKCKRLNLCVLDIPSYNNDDLKTYKIQMDEIGKLLVSEYRSGHPVELSFLTDRILLKEMNNCNAGITHITVGPDGCFYPCPGFYHLDKLGSSEHFKAGDLDNGITIPNRQLLRLDHAPVCSICDAWHCKRCIYLNNVSTLEMNTPSYQQCALSHLERDTSRIILSRLQDSEPFTTVDPIEELEYLDPLLILTGKVKKKPPPAPQVGEEKIPAGKPLPPAGETLPLPGKKAVTGEDFITVKDGDTVVKLPRLKQVVPGKNIIKKLGSRVNKKKIKPENSQEELDTVSVKRLLLDIVKTQKEILELLKRK
jgi:CXXX repeat peptide maturase